MLQVIVASLAFLLTFGSIESTVVESPIEPAHIPSPVPVHGPKVIAKIIPGEVVSKFASKVLGVSEYFTKPVVTAVGNPIIVPDSIITVPVVVKNGFKYTAAQSKYFWQQTQAQIAAKLAKIKAAVLSLVTKMKQKQIAVGRVLLKPVVIVGAAKSSLAGKGLKAVGYKIENIGNKISAIGNFAQVKGALLIGKSKQAWVNTVPRVQLIPAVKTLSVSIPVVKVASVEGSTSLKGAHVSTGGAHVSTGGAHVSTGGAHVSAGALAVRRKRNTEKGPLEFRDLLRIVESLNLKDCVLRIICQLNCDPEAFGKGGLTVYNSLVRFEVSRAAKGEDSLVYRESALKGRNLRRPPKDCVKCLEAYPSCNAKTADLIGIASRIEFH